MDERRDCPSASTMERTLACPGWLRESKGVKPAPAGEDAESGTRVHAWLAGEPVDIDSREELDLAIECSHKAAELIRDVFNSRPYLRFKEHRMWNQFPPFSGRFDDLCIRGKTALLIDYKTGHEGAKHAFANLQLRAGVVLLQENHDVESVRCAIVAPLAKSTDCFYGPDDIDRAREQIYDIVEKTMQPDAPTAAGTHCQYCPAARALTCATFREYAQEAASDSLLPANTVATKETVRAAFRALGSDELAYILDRRESMKWFLESAESEARERIETGDYLPWWTLKQNSPREKITDLSKVAERAMALGIGAQAIVSIATTSKAALSDLVRESTGRVGRELKQTVAGLVEGATECTQPKPTLVREQ